MTKTLKYIISLAVAAILLFFSFRGVKWSDFAAGLSGCRWSFVVLSMAVSIAAFWIRGLRWREILLPIDDSTRRVTTYNAVCIGYIANFVFPRIGEFVRCGYVTSRKASYDKALGTVVLERAWDMLTLMILTAALLLCEWSRFGDFFVQKIWAPASGRLDISLWWIIAVIAVLGIAAIWAVVRFRDRNRLAGKVYGFAAGMIQGLGSCLKMERKWRFFIYTVLLWTCYWMMSASIIMAVPQTAGLDLTDALFLMVAGSLGWVIPVPGGFGAFHYIVALALSTLYGIPWEMGIIFATLSHESQAITMLLCGGSSYAWESFSRIGGRKAADEEIE